MRDAGSGNWPAGRRGAEAWLKDGADVVINLSDFDGDQGHVFTRSGTDCTAVRDSALFGEVAREETDANLLARSFFCAS